MHRRILAALFSLLALSSCLSSCLQREPTEPNSTSGAVMLSVRADVANTAVAMVVVQVTAADIAPPLIFNVPTLQGVASGAISVPAGSNRTFTLRAYDAGGIETHAGSVTKDVQPGTNPTISIVLTPLTGNSSVTVTLGSFHVTVTPATDSLAPGDTAQLTATVLDASNNPDTGQVTWATLNPNVATVVSTGKQTARVTGIGIGQATLVAVYAGIGGSAAVTVHSSGGIFPLHVDAGKRYLVDAHGNPFFLQGDAGWELFTQLTNEEAEQYLEDRRQKGFNTVLAELVEHKFSANPPYNVYGDAPFRTPGDFSTPNEAYFAHCAYVMNLAAQKGILLLITPAYMGVDGDDEGWYQEMVANGTAKLSTYGTYLANRFRAYDNIIWVEGGDYNPPDLNILRAIPNAMRAAEPKWLHTFHGSEGTSALAFLPSEPWLQVNDVYTYFDWVSFSFTEYARSTTPFFLIEGRYEGEGADEAQVRQQAYQVVLSGGTGQIMGNNPIWLFTTGWQAALNSPGARTLSYLPALFAGRTWWTLVPDTNHTVLTAGINGGVDQAATAVTSDGSFALAYLPSARSVTVNLSKLSGPHVVARWYDPANGTYTSVSGSPFTAASGPRVFTPAATNSSGFSDWVLVLDSSP